MLPPQPAVGRREPCRLQHGPGWIHSGQLDSVRAAGGELAQQVAGPAPDIEDTTRRGRQRHGQIRGAVGYLLMQPSEPPALVAARACVERGDITIMAHGQILSPA